MGDFPWFASVCIGIVLYISSLAIFKEIKAEKAAEKALVECQSKK